MPVGCWDERDLVDRDPGSVTETKGYIMGQVVRMSMNLAQESLNILRELASESSTAITTMPEC